MRDLPLFSPFSMSRYEDLYEVLALLEPAETYEIMSRITAAERCGPLLERGGQMVEHVRSRLALAPGALARFSLEDVAEQFSRYVLDLNFDNAFLAVYLRNRDLVAEGVIELGNIEVFDSALADERPLVLLPMHTGPVYASLPVLARRRPITTLYHNLPFDELRTSYFPGVDLDGISVPRPNLGKECLDVLAAGRVLSIFPEFDPSGPGRLHVEVPFLGARVLAPSGAALISQRTGAQLLPLVFTRSAPGHYRFEFGSLITVGPGADARRAATTEVFAFLEAHLLRSEPGAWEIWWEFERMLAPVGAL